LAEFTLFLGDINEAYEHIKTAHQLSSQLIDPDLDIQVQINKGMIDAYAKETYQELWDTAESLFPPMGEYEMHTPTILMGYILAAAGLENIEMLNYFLNRGLGFLELLNATEQEYSWFLPMFAKYLQLTGDLEKAALCLGFFDQFAPNSLSWQSDSPLMSKLRKNLIDGMGEKAYKAAWEQGKSTPIKSIMNISTLEGTG
jgi:hypothetical protein